VRPGAAVGSLNKVGTGEQVQFGGGAGGDSFSGVGGLGAEQGGEGGRPSAGGEGTELCRPAARVW